MRGSIVEKVIYPFTNIPLIVKEMKGLFVNSYVHLREGNLNTL